MDSYTVLRRLGIDADIVGQFSDLAKYKLVVAPTISLIGSDLEKRLEGHNGSLIVGPRSASKVEVLSISKRLPPIAACPPPSPYGSVSR